jgi:hypothetical protein
MITSRRAARAAASDHEDIAIVQLNDQRQIAERRAAFATIADDSRTGVWARLN